MPDSDVSQAGEPQQQPRFSDDALERARLLFAQAPTFVKGVVAIDGLPACDRVEVAFAGRSNVGKSSLLNALTGRKSLARTSNTPGRTRELNFFALTDALYLVDLPGYGYARIERRKAESWSELTRSYLRGRACLKRLFVLIDARHGVKASDEELMAELDVAAVSYQLVLTKADKPKKGDIDKIAAETEAAARKHPAAHPFVAITSSLKNTGLADLRAEIAALAEQS